MNPITPARSLDLRSLPTWDRHARIFAAFDELRDATVLTVITDHEPRPLRLQFEQRYPDEFVWDQRQLGIARWEVSLRRAPPIPGRRAFLRRCALLCDATEETASAIDQNNAIPRRMRRATGVLPSRASTDRKSTRLNSSHLG